MYTQLNPLNRIQRDPLSAALIAGGASLIGGGVNAYAQGKMNKKTREWNEKMYEKQRTDNEAIWNKQNSYNESMWAMQNDYNSPQSQMKRLRESGLNPNLVYGTGTVANNAQAIRSSDTPNASPASWQPRAPEIGSMATNSIGAYQDVRLKQAQYDNLKAINTKIAQDTALASANTASSLTKNARSQFDLDMARSLQSVSAEMARKNLLKLSSEAGIAEAKSDTELGRAGYQSIAYDKSYNKLMDEQSLKKMRSTIQNIDAGTTLRKFETQMKDMGISASDPFYIRMLGRLYEKYK